MKKIIASILIAAFAAVTTLPARAADDAKPAAPRATPFRGKIDSVDKQAKTFKINDRTFNITADTKIVKDGKPATSEDVAAGQDVAGQYREGADKKLNVVGLRIGGRPPQAKPVPAKDEKK